MGWAPATPLALAWPAPLLPLLRRGLPRNPTRAWGVALAQPGSIMTLVRG